VRERGLDGRLRRRAPGVAVMQAANPGQADEGGGRGWTALHRTPARGVLAEAEVRSVGQFPTCVEMTLGEAPVSCVVASPL
jgi:hypothetical protein